MRRAARRGIVALSIAAVCACGGGGRGGGASGGLSVTPGSASFTGVFGSALPAAQTLQVRFTNPDVSYLEVGYPPGASVATWLATPTAGGSGGNRTLGVAVNTTSISPGTRTTTLRIAAFRADGTPIAYVDVPVTYVLRAFGATPAAIGSSFVLGSSAAPAAQSVAVGGASGTPWTASADQAWVHLSSAAGTVPASVTVAFDPTGLGVGQHAASLTFAGGGETASVDVTLTVTPPTLTATPATVQLAGASGHDLAGKPLQLALDTGTNAYGWTATASDSWFEIAPTAGTVSSTPATITVRPSAAASAWPAGSHDGSITLIASVGGNTLTKVVGVHYQLDDEKLLVSEDGVAFASVPPLFRLTRSLRVRTNRGRTVSWSATSDETWLTVTPTGTTADPLVLTADATGLAADALHEATVTLTSGDAGIGNVESVRVGLWVGSTAPAAITTVASTYQEIATDPVRPYAYAHAGGTDVAVYHVHTGALVATIAGAGTKLGSMAVAGDGSRLFVVDDGATPRAVVPIDLAARTTGTPWALPASAPNPTRIAYARTNGVRLVLASGGSVHDAATGSAYAARFVVPFSSSGVVLATSRDGSRACALNMGVSLYEVRCYALDATSASGSATTPVFGTAMLGSAGSNGQEVALSADGSRVYVAAGAPYSFTQYDATAGASRMPVVRDLAGLPWPTAVEVGSDGRIYCGRDSSGASSEPAVWVYDDAGALQSSYLLYRVLPRLLRVSGDALRMVVGVGAAGGSPAATKLVTVGP